MKQSFSFERSFRTGYKCYNGKVGMWWYERSLNSPHQYAYKKLVEYIASFYLKRKKTPRFIVDYACGPGDVLFLLVKKFPSSYIIGLDGSRIMLEYAGKALRGKGVAFTFAKPENAFKKDSCNVKLVKTKLPNFSLPKKKADLAVFAFPNIVPKIAEQPYYDRHGYRNRKDARIGWILSEFKEKNPIDDIHIDPDELFDQLMTNKVISRNLAHLLKKGGISIRADYAGAARENLTNGARLRTDFEQGALAEKVDGYKAKQIFKLVHSTYKHSNVILDVYHQTKNKDDKSGGYLISTLKCIV